MRGILLASACAAAMVATTSSAQAQPAPNAQEEAQPPATGTAEAQRQQAAGQDAADEDEIFVTATLRTARLRDVPLSVTAFSQEELTDLGIVGYEGIAQNTPGIVVNRPTQNFNNFTARGINTNGYSAGLQSAVAIYIDELPISANGNSTILDPNLYDVERVEFLRGPQDPVRLRARSPAPCGSSPRSGSRRDRGLRAYRLRHHRRHAFASATMR
jgi:outer membrane receptor protein involved in Fe transport